MLLLTACVSDPVVKVETPRLAAPPSGVIDDLEARCKVKKDESACRWVIQLEKHYRKIN